jgi:hypothetical protein
LDYRVADKVVVELPKDRAAVRRIGEVVLERGETGDYLAVHTEGGHPVRDPLLGVGDDLEDRLTQPLK